MDTQTLDRCGKDQEEAKQVDLKLVESSLPIRLQWSSTLCCRLGLSGPEHDRERQLLLLAS